MKFIIPEKITRDMVLENTISESVTPWSPLTNYVEDALVVYNVSDTTKFPKIYQSLQGSNLGNTPDEEVSLWWQEIGYSNSYALFDKINSKQAVSTDSSITISLLNSTGWNTLALINTDIGDIEITVVYNNTLVYTKYVNYSYVYNWLDYYNFGNSSGQQKYLPTIFEDIPSYKNSVVTLKIRKALSSNTIAIGEIVFGNLFEFGYTQRGISAGITDYSIKETDTFGNILFVERNFSKRISCSVLISNKKFNECQRVLYKIRATPVLWITTSDEELSEATIVYGYYKNFSSEIQYPEYTTYNLEIEGLI